MSAVNQILASGYVDRAIRMTQATRRGYRWPWPVYAAHHIETLMVARAHWGSVTVEPIRPSGRRRA
jgi:hypothetical protein